MKFTPWTLQNSKNLLSEYALNHRNSRNRVLLKSCLDSETAFKIEMRLMVHELRNSLISVNFKLEA